MRTLSRDLSVVELTCDTLISIGAEIAEITQSLAFLVHAVQLYLEMAVLKLDAANTSHAFTTAIRVDLIDRCRQKSKPGSRICPNMHPDFTGMLVRRSLYDTR